MTTLTEATATFDAHVATCTVAGDRTTHYRVCTAGHVLQAAEFDAEEMVQATES